MLYQAGFIQYITCICDQSENRLATEMYNPLNHSEKKYTEKFLISEISLQLKALQDYPVLVSVPIQTTIYGICSLQVLGTLCAVHV